MQIDMPLLLSKTKAMAYAGISRHLFEAIEPELPFVRPKKAKLYCPEDIKREIENLKRCPSIHLPNKTKTSVTASTLLSQLTVSGGLDAAVKRIKERTQTNTR